MSSDVQPVGGSYLTPSFERACVGDVMRRGVMSCPADAPLVTVAQTMATHHIHAVVVGGIADNAGDDERTVWGLISDMDLVRAAAEGLEGRDAEEIARTRAVTVDASLPLTDAARLMQERGTAHLLVTDGRRPVGMVSSLDIAGVLAWGRG
jgi:CBS domain-containing protein